MVVYLQDNEVILKMNFIMKHGLKLKYAENSYKGEYFYFPQFVFNDNA